MTLNEFRKSFQNLVWVITSIWHKRRTTATWVGNLHNMDRNIISTHTHYNDVIMDAMASLITSLTIVYSTVYSGEDQRRHQSSASLAFVQWINRWPVNSPHKWPVTRKMFPLDDVILHQFRQLMPTQQRQMGYNCFLADGWNDLYTWYASV